MGLAKQFWEEAERREAVREAYEYAKTVYPMDELGEKEGWDFVEALVAEFGYVPDPCCCCARKTAQGAYEMEVSERLWKEAVIATVKAQPCC